MGLIWVETDMAYFDRLSQSSDQQMGKQTRYKIAEIKMTAVQEYQPSQRDIQQNNTNRQL
jgi:hypothetical protein